MSRTGVAVVYLASALALVLALHPRTALADDDDDDDESALSSRRTNLTPEPCPAEEGIVGRRACPEYGVWGAARESPYATISFGVNFRRLPRQSVDRTQLARSVTTPGMLEGGSDLSYSLMEQVVVSITDHLYGGFEVEISPTDAQAAPGARLIAAGSQLLFGFQGGTKFVKLGLEAAGGSRLIVTDNPDDDDSELVLEGRARADLWLTPWVTIGGSLGRSFLHHDEWVAGVYLAAHTYSFGGH